MFDYTKDYIDLLKRDFKRVDLIFSVISIIATIVYPIFAIIVKLGNLYVNIAVLVLAVIYSLIVLMLGDSKKFKMDRIYTWMKIFISTIALSINIYSIYIATTNVNGVAIILSTIMTIFWILKVALNLVYDIAMPRLQTLALCVIEDSKPYCAKADFVSELVTRKPMFNLPKETPEEVLRVAKKSKRVSSELKENAVSKEINSEYKEILENVDINNDGSIGIEELIAKAIEINGVVVDKKRFMHQEFATRLSKEEIDRLIKYGPIKGGLTENQLSYLCDGIRDENILNIEIVKKYLTDDGIDYKSDKDFKKLLQAFSLTLIAMQKIIYLYGFRQIESDLFDSYQLSGLLYALSILIDDNANDSKRELFIMKKCDLKDDLLTMAAGKLGFAKNHQSEIKNGIIRALPKAAGLASKYSKGKLGLALKAAQVMIECNKKK